MTVRKLNLEDFKENQLSRQQTINITGCAPVPPPPPLPELPGDPVIPYPNGDIRGGGEVKIIIP